MDHLLTTIVQELSGKEFTKDDLMKLICETEPVTDTVTTDVDIVTTDTGPVNQRVLTRDDLLDSALSIKAIRTSGSSWRSVAWKELYENEEYCKKFIESDMERLRLGQIERIKQEEANKQANKQWEQLKHNKLTKEERDLQWCSKIEVYKQYLIRNM